MFSTTNLILLGLHSASVNLVGAIDIYLYRAEHSCSGTAHVCTNINPNTCCGQGGNDAHSLAWRAKPTSWSLDLRGHSDGQCGRVTAAGQSGTGNTDICWTASNPNAFPTGDFSGAGYSFRNLRRGTVEAQCVGESQPCSAQQKPDRLDLADGTKYNLAALEEAELQELLSFANGTDTIASDIPAQFDLFKI